MRCPNCRNKNPHNINNCLRCGADLIGRRNSILFLIGMITIAVILILTVLIILIVIKNLNDRVYYDEYTRTDPQNQLQPLESLPGLDDVPYSGYTPGGNPDNDQAHTEEMISLQQFLIKNSFRREGIQLWKYDDKTEQSAFIVTLNKQNYSFSYKRNKVKGKIIHGSYPENHEWREDGDVYVSPEDAEAILQNIYSAKK